MKRVIIFGAGKSGKNRYKCLKDKYDVEVVAYADNDSEKWGGRCNDICIIAPEEIQQFEYDEILIAVIDFEVSEEIRAELRKLNILDEKIVDLATSVKYMDIYMEPRFGWIQDFGKWVSEQKIKGSVAECGVYRGDSAKFINKFFPDRKLYLFDTFEGFSEDDVKFEKCLGNSEFNDSKFALEPVFRNTSVGYVLKKMPFPENICIKKGYFPESACEINDRFCFVNLDMDLYAPMLNGLQFFWERLETNGCILLHDYFHPNLPGVKKAVEAFEQKCTDKIFKTVIGDRVSIALFKG